LSWRVYFHIADFFGKQRRKGLKIKTPCGTFTVVEKVVRGPFAAAAQAQFCK
jgi:hypothetical protein